MSKPITTVKEMRESSEAQALWSKLMATSGAYHLDVVSMCALQMYFDAVHRDLTKDQALRCLAVLWDDFTAHLPNGPIDNIITADIIQ
jgi:hypothetical protein